MRATAATGGVGPWSNERSGTAAESQDILATISEGGSETLVTLLSSRPNTAIGTTGGVVTMMLETGDTSIATVSPQSLTFARRTGT